MTTTVVTPQSLVATVGQEVTWTVIDTANGNATPNVRANRVRVLIRTQATSTGVVTFVSTACAHGRFGDLAFTLGASKTYSFGPFTDPSIWGDGSSLEMQYDSIVNTVHIAVVY